MTDIERNKEFENILNTELIKSVSCEFSGDYDTDGRIIITTQSDTVITLSTDGDWAGSHWFVFDIQRNMNNAKIV